MTGIDLYKFILRNRRGKAFADWSRHDILRRVSIAVNTKECLVYEEGGQILGMAMGTRLLHGDKVGMHVDQILTTRPGIVGIFFREFLRRFPECEMITGKRHGRPFFLHRHDYGIFDKKLKLT